MIRLEAVQLRCENRITPLGVGVQAPVLSWLLNSSRRGEQQIAYQILVASSLERLTKHDADYWNSGKVSSTETVNVRYQGKPLPSMVSCYWVVRVWGRDGRESKWSAPARWVMGVLTQREWFADWIGAISDKEANLPTGRNYHLHHVGSAPDDPWAAVPDLAKASIMLRKEIFVSDGLNRATVFVCGLGAFEMLVNGSNISDHFLEPAWTDYNKRCPYLTYDMTKALHAGENAVGVILGNSMYNVVGGRYSKFVGSYGPPKMILQMCLEYDDGRLEWFISDSTWQWALSPITFNCIFGGEDYDSRMEQKNWSLPDFSEGNWQQVKQVSPPKGQLVSEIIAPRKVQKVIEPVNVTEPCPGVLVFDLGQNFAGRMRICVSGSAGQTVRMLPGELLDNEGFVTQKNMTHGREDWTTEYNYTLKGEGEETWAPRFSYTGFRYVQAEGASLEQQNGYSLIHELVGEAIYLDVSQAGTFDCSCQKVMEVYKLINEAVKSNLQSIATDCPHREKLGWLEQVYLMGPSLLYQYDLQNFLHKVIRDMQDAQQEDGLIPDIAPEYVVFENGFRDSPEWGAASVLLPWLLYIFYGDVGVLEKSFDSMLRYVNFLESQSSDYIVTHGLGDWYDFSPAPFGVSQLTSMGVTATAIFYEITDCLAKIAQVIGRDDQVEILREKAKRIREAFNRRFLSNDGGAYDRGSQTACAMPLVNHIVPQESITTVSEHLVKDVKDHQYQITAGDIGHVYVLRALSEMGADEVILNSIRREKKFGYLYQLAMGASTLTEAWNADTSQSQNHFMLGHAMEWFYTSLAGIQFDERFPKYHQVVIHPKPVGDIDWVSATYQTIFGKLEVSWILAEEQFTLELTIPMNMTALVMLPTDAPRFVRESGISIYEIAGMKYLGLEDGKSMFEVSAGKFFITTPVS